MNFDDLKPGPELDRLIAENVMECVVAGHPHRSDAFIMASSQRAIGKARAGGVYFQGWDDEGNAEFCHKLLHYSTNIAAAWQIVDKLQSEGHRITICIHEDSSYLFNFCTIDQDPVHEDECLAEHEATTVPLAICIAALKALGE